LGAVAADLNYSRATLCLVLSGKYDADTHRVEEAVMEAFGAISCPFEGREIESHACRAWCDRTVPTSSAWALRHWATCQSCVHNLKPSEKP